MVKPNEALRVPARIGPQKSPVDIIIDTGAAVSILGSEVATTIPGLEWKERYNGPEIGIADGGPLPISGVAHLDVELGSTVRRIPFLVAKKFPYGCLLGNDFLREKKNQVSVFLSEEYLQIGEDRIGFSKVRDENRTFTLYNATKVRLPPYSQTILKLSGVPDYVKKSDLMICEPSQEFNKKFPVVGMKIISWANSSTYVPFFNPTCNEVVLNPYTRIGEAELQSPSTCLVAEVPDKVGEKEEKIPQEEFQEFKDKLALKLPGLSEEQQMKLLQLLYSHKEEFSIDSTTGRTNITTHKIDTGDINPIRGYFKRFSDVEHKEAEKAVEEMLKNDLIEESTSPWSSPVVLVKKKDGTLRFCVDYRKLNSETRKDSYPMPRVDETLDALRGTQWFSALDLKSGFWQVPMDESSKEKTAFRIRNGLYQYKVMPMGLTNSPATFQRLMDLVLAKYKWQFCLVYIDDIIIYSKTFEEHLEHLKCVFVAIKNAGLKCSLKKCQFAMPEIKYLGHVISRQGTSPDPDKISAVKNFPTPKSVEEVRRFVGLAGYYRRFIPNFSTIASPLTQLFKKDGVFLWTEDCQKAFETLREHLISSPILAFPDFSLPFKLVGDASLVGVGSALVQSQNGREVVIGYTSRTLNKAERNYSTTERECLAIINGCRVFRPYLHGKQFQVVTDHRSLQWLFDIKEPQSRLLRWVLKLSEFNFDITYQSGKSLAWVDALSRAPERKELLLSQVLPVVLRGVPLDLFKSSQKRDRNLSKFWKNAQDKIEIEGIKFIEEDGLLYRVVKKGKSSKEEEYLKQLVVPENYKYDILHMCHDILLSGHLGITATYERLKKRFYWFGMKRDTEHWISHCPDCEARKTPANISKSGKLQSIAIVPEPFHTIGVDIVGPLTPTEEHKYQYIIVFTDYFTKWAEAFPMRTQDANTVAQILLKEIVLRHGIPKRILSDRGKVFIGQVLTYVYNLLGIEKLTTTSYHPQTDGLTEKLNGTLIGIITKYVSSNHKDWDVYLPYAVFAYRTAVQTSTKYSPYFLLYGREPRTPLDITLLPDPPRTPKSTDEFVSNFQQRLSDAYRLAHDNIEVAQSRQTFQFNKNKKDVEFQVGDKVRLWIPNIKKGQTKKLLSNWHGPYEILKRVSPLTYQVSVFGNSKMHGIIHVSRMKPFRDPSEPLPSEKYVKDPDEDVLEPSSEQAPDAIVGDLPFPYEKNVDPEDIINNDIVPPPVVASEPEKEETISVAPIQQEEISAREDNEFPLPQTTSRNGFPRIEEQEEILDKKIEKKNGKSKTLYLVKWKNKSKEESTWHSQGGLSRILLKKYNAEHKKKK
jgi:hypothetical protein